MKIVKRSGVEEIFEREKIAKAIEKANNATEGKPELSQRQIEYIVNVIEDYCRDMESHLSGSMPALEYRRLGELFHSGVCETF